MSISIVINFVEQLLPQIQDDSRNHKLSVLLQDNLEHYVRLNKELAAKYRQLQGNYLALKGEMLDRLGDRVKAEMFVKDLKKVNAWEKLSGPHCKSFQLDCWEIDHCSRARKSGARLAAKNEGSSEFVQPTSQSVQPKWVVPNGVGVERERQTGDDLDFQSRYIRCRNLDFFQTPD